MLTDDLDAVFLNTSEFGESITYWHRDAPTRARTITAVVHRHQLRDEAEQYHRATTEVIDVTCKNSATAGINDPGVGDCVQLSGDPADVRWSYVETKNTGSGGRVLTFRRTNLRQSGERPRTR